MTYILMRREHIASYQHVLLTKNSFPVYPTRKRLTKKGPDPYEEDVDTKELRTCADETLDAKPPAPYRPPEVWEQRERDGHMPKVPDFPVCSSFCQHVYLDSTSLHTLHLDTGYWGDRASMVSDTLW